MKVTIGIDVGGSTTKIVGFDRDKNIIAPMHVKANDQLTSVYGAFGKFCAQNNIDLDDIDDILMTGVGATYVTSPLYRINCKKEIEFPCIARGGLYLSGLEEAIVVSMGTGTAIVYAKADGTHKYLGGTGVGGGTMMGLSKKFLGVSSVHNFSELAAEGDISKIDLRVCDITKNDIHPDLPSTLTAANFGKVNDLATNSDIALGILNMIFETIAMLAIFAARSYNIKDIVLTGNLTNISKCEEIFQSLNEHFGVNFIIPQNARYATVIGAALSNFN